MPPRLKRVHAKPKKSILHKGKDVYRTQQDAADAQAYVPEERDHKLVQMAAANKTPKTQLLEFFGITERTFDKYFHDDFIKGAMSRNLRVTQTIFDEAVGSPGIYDKKRKKWVALPVRPNMTAAIWWDKTRNGMTETSNVNVKGKNVGMNPNLVLFMPYNGREVGAGGDPLVAAQLEVKRQEKLLELRAKDITPTKK